MGFNFLTFGQPEPELLVMWGSAAWAQTQLTPGVSALAAPRSSIRPWLRRANQRISYPGRKESTMTRARLAGEIVKLLSGAAGLFVGLSLLWTAPLTAVLVILGAMGFMLIAVAKLCGAEIRR